MKKVAPKLIGNILIYTDGFAGGDSTLIRRVYANSVLNLPSCSGVEKPKKYTLFWNQERWSYILFWSY